MALIAELNLLFLSQCQGAYEIHRCTLCMHDP